MKPDRVLATATLALGCGGVQAYHIVEGRYRVETAPGVFEDQLVVRCDDARTITVPWETRLAEACGESLMGGPAPKALKAASQEPPRKPRAGGRNAQRCALAGGCPRAKGGDAHPGPRAVRQPARALHRVQAKCGRVVHAVSAAAFGHPQEVRDLPQGARAARRLRGRARSGACQPDRHRAAGRSRQGRQAGDGNRGRSLNLPSIRLRNGVKSTEPSALPPQPQSVKQVSEPATTASDRAAAEQKIGEDYSWCMRVKPKFECDQARTKALSELDKPKTPKAKRPAA